MKELFFSIDPMSITPESVQILLTSADLGDRLRGVNEIRQLDPVIGFPLLQNPLYDSSARVRYAAVSQLDTLGHQDLVASLEVLRDRLHNDSEYDVKAAAADALGALKLTEAFPDLETVYHETTEWLLQFSIIAALGEMGDPRALPLLAIALKSTVELVQTAAIGAIGELRLPAGIALLQTVMTDADWQVRYRLAQALGNIGGTEAQVLLRQLAQDLEPKVAEQAQSLLTL
jgi:HEAT repeat protein